MSKTKQLRVSLNFRRLLDDGLLSRGRAIHTGLDGNPNYPKPPVELPVLLATLDRFSFAIAEALDGGKKAITEKDGQRETLIRMLRQLGHYVEASCKDDPATLSSSGFEAATATRVPAAQPLTRPAIRKVDQGNSGQLMVRVQTIAKARSYELRYAAVRDGTPGPWSTVTVTSARIAAAVSDLTPGTIYAFQVRALGRLGFTDWSDSATRMCI